MLGQEASGRVERDPLRLAAVLLLAGLLVTVVAWFLHPEGADANDHRAIFAIYAASQSWTAVHLGQFVGMVIIVFGLGALFFALDPPRGAGLWLDRMGLLTAGAALALYAVLQAVDGVGLKQAVNASAAAGNGDKAVRFDSAETVRWLEWAVRSDQSYVFGLSLILFGAAIAVVADRVPRPIGYLMALPGLCHLARGGSSAPRASRRRTSSRPSSASPWSWSGASGSWSRRCGGMPRSHRVGGHGCSADPSVTCESAVCSRRTTGDGRFSRSIEQSMCRNAGAVCCRCLDNHYSRRAAP